MHLYRRFDIIHMLARRAKRVIKINLTTNFSSFSIEYLQLLHVLFITIHHNNSFPTTFLKHAPKTLGQISVKLTEYDQMSAF